MRLRRKDLKTGELIACFPPEAQGRNASLLLLVEGAADIPVLHAFHAAFHRKLTEYCRSSTVVNQLELSAVEPHLDPEQLVRLEAAELREVAEPQVLHELLAPAVEQLCRAERVRFPSASRTEGSVARGPDFIGREQELAELKRRVLEKRHVLLVAPRRSGKTALLYRLQEELSGQARVELIDAERRTSALNFVAELQARATGQPFTSALKDVRAASWQQVVGTALEKMAAGSERPLVLLLDELAMFLEQVRPEEGTALLAALDDAVRRVGASVVVAGSLDLRRLVALRSDLSLPGLFGSLEVHNLPPLAEERLEVYLRRVLMGTGLVLEPGDMKWLRDNVDLAMPYPALQFLSHLASVARERALDAAALERELQGFLQTTHAFRETESHLDKLAEEDSDQFERTERLVNRLAQDSAGLAAADARALLSSEQEEQDRRMQWLVEHLPMRTTDEQVRLASRLFRRYWQARLERSR